MSLDEERLELLRLAEELAATRLGIVARHWGLDYKYRPGQTRIAAGNGRASGQFADEGRGTARRMPKTGSSALKEVAKRLAPHIAKAIVTNPELGLAAAAAAVPAMATGVAMSRPAGLASVLADGGGKMPGSVHMTPFLGIPYRLDTVTAVQDYDRSAAELIRIREECEDQREKDELECQVSSAMHGRKKDWYTKEAIYAICMQQTRKRYE